jgi:hypothetical protein
MNFYLLLNTEKQSETCVEYRHNVLISQLEFILVEETEKLFKSLFLNVRQFDHLCEKSSNLLWRF